MNTKVQRSILAGIIGTAIITLVMMISPMMGTPEMSPPEMLSTMWGIPVFAGWLMHFSTGIVLAFAYTYLCVFKTKIGNVYAKGAIFGMSAFVVGQTAMILMEAPMPGMKDSIIPAMLGSLSVHIIFGIVVAKTVGNAYLPAVVFDKQGSHGN